MNYLNIELRNDSYRMFKSTYKQDLILEFMKKIAFILLNDIPNNNGCSKEYLCKKAVKIYRNFKVFAKYVRGDGKSYLRLQQVRSIVHHIQEMVYPVNGKFHPLPDEIIQHVFTYLDSCALGRIGRANKRMLVNANEAFVAMAKSCGFIGNDSKAKHYLKKRFIDIKYLLRTGVFNDVRKCEEIIRSFRSDLQTANRLSFAQSLLQAVKECKRSLVKTHIVMGVFPKTSSNLTPLHLAVRTKYIKMVSLILYQQSYKVSDSQYSAYDTTKEITELFLKTNMDINRIIDGVELMPLVKAVRDYSYDSVVLLLKKGADPNIIYYGKPLIFQALSSISINILKVLLDYGADPHIPSLEGELPIEFALKKGYSSSVELLLSYHKHRNKND